MNSYTYDPFGEALVDQGTFGNPFMFTGQWYDDEIEQYYLRARMYDPALMRFTGRDPVKGKFKNPMTLNVYLYCLNDPINRVDPRGEEGTLAEQLGVSGARAAAAGIDAGVAWLIYGRAQSLMRAIAARNMATAFVTAGISRGVSGAIKIGLAWYDYVAGSGVFPHPLPADPSKPRGDGWEWRGKGEPGTSDGNWYNPDTDEYLHPDLDHPGPIGPHYNYRDK